MTSEQERAFKRLLTDERNDGWFLLACAVAQGVVSFLDRSRFNVEIKFDP